MVEGSGGFGNRNLQRLNLTHGLKVFRVYGKKYCGFLLELFWGFQNKEANTCRSFRFLDRVLGSLWFIALLWSWGL